MRVKVCGITRVEDALAAEAAGADAVGFIFVPRSKRYVTRAQAGEMGAALGPFIARVGVFVNAPLEEVVETAQALRLNAVQLHGLEDAAYAARLRAHVRVIKAFSFTPELTWDALAGFPADAVLLDGLQPGSGERFDWSGASRFSAAPHLILAGGLTPENVAAGISALRPYGVDVASGVESRPGIKSPRKIQDFVCAVRAAQSSTVIHRGAPACG